jgi:nucleotide-binding universal stress UspA family protein
VRTVLIATDGSESAGAALEFAIEIAQDADAALHVLSVRPPARSTHDEGRLRAVEELGGAQHIAAAAARRARSAGLVATPHVAYGDIVTSIADAVSMLGADLLVVGSRGHSLSEGPRALGGVAQALVRNAPVPVTVVHHTRLAAGEPSREPAAAEQEPVVQSWSMFE